MRRSAIVGFAVCAAFSFARAENVNVSSQSSGGLGTLVSSGPIPAAATWTLQLTGTYKQYRVIVSNWGQTNADFINFQLSENGGTTYHTGGGDYQSRIEQDENPPQNGSFSSPIYFAAPVKYITSNGTYTPTANATSAIVDCAGGGAGAGGAAASATGTSSGGGGGGGSLSRKMLTVSDLQHNFTVTIGAAANGGATGNNGGTNGNDTTVVNADTSVNVCTGKGGTAGGGAAANSAGTAGAGGVAGTGDETHVGNSGARGFSSSITTADGSSGNGAGGPFGGFVPGVDANAAAVDGINGTDCGAGGSGGQSQGSASTAKGGNGAAGCVRVQELIITSPNVNINTSSQGYAGYVRAVALPAVLSGDITIVPNNNAQIISRLGGPGVNGYANFQTTSSFLVTTTNRQNAIQFQSSSAFSSGGFFSLWGIN